MRLFWEQGYEKTSINDLVEYMDIHLRSLYDTFAGKDQLFQKVLKRYKKFLYGHIQFIITPTKSSKAALRSLFDFIIERNDEANNYLGCLFVNTAVELAPRSSDSNSMVKRTSTSWKSLSQN
ncbi:TetR/AcrR family transcriptional regulator [Paenibacillus sp. CGMCC 1.16610]|uniref:TetR family transcriptional regulator n=1 Tax=Paenibacillus anseongense TaxID=2682845 RepID=A0ABW9UPK6_9BACL|nr:TetR/AcrR family transcriptional regulator [Paenibacillus sp. CGMCC 1.16610]MVQ39855.1 TetR family transcriptional regulator [Paenibacillus anseongense]